MAGQRKAEKKPIVGNMWWWVRSIFVWLVILGAIAAITVAVLIPRLGGATPYTVLTGSMQPNYPPGTLVVIKPAEIDDIRVGDVITYQLESGQHAVATHRVVDRRTNLRGETIFITQGDANSIPDAEPVQPVQIRGKLWYSVPYLGYVNNAISGQMRQVVTYGVVTVLVLYAAYMFTGSVRDRANARREEKTKEDAS